MITGTRSWLQGMVVTVALLCAHGAAAERAILSYRSTDISSQASVSAAASRTHRIRLNPEALAARHFQFTTPDGITYLAKPSRRSARTLDQADGSYTVSGSLVAASDVQDVGAFTIAYSGRGLHGSLSLTDRSLVLDGDTMQEINTDAFPGCADAPAASPDHLTHTDDHAAKGNAHVAAAGDTVTIDVMIAFSNSYSLLSAAQREAFAASAIESANTSYANSGVNQRLRLVDTYLTNYTESGDLATDLSRLYTQGDGQLDEIATRRTEKGADLVSLIVESMNYCGIAYLMTTPSSAFKALGLSVVNYSCAVGNLSFAHELGHNMGAMHANPEAGNSTGAYSYSFGSRFIGSNGVQYRDIMAYAPGIRVPHFSNPDVTYLGAATGSAAANVALTLNNTAAIIAGYEGSDAVTAPAPTPTPATGYSISGTVMDELGQPIVNAKIEVRYAVGSKKRVVRAKSTTSGSFTVPNVKSGAAYTVKVSVPSKRYLLASNSAAGTLSSDVVLTFTATLTRGRSR